MRFLFGLPGFGKAEVGDKVGLGWTGPMERRDCAKSGSEASRLMASSREPAARAWGFTVGPGSWLGAGGGCGGAFVAAWEGGAGAGLLGYWRAAEPAARDALDPDAPIVVL